MWSPTHVQVLVKKAKGLKIKGKDGTNDAFVTIALGKEKYQTSVKEKASESVEWCEQCELIIPQQGNTAEISLNVLHRNFLGVDEFLGMISMPLRDFDVYERPKTKWYPLKCKPGQTKNDYRGDLEVRTSFTVKSVDQKDPDKLGSTADINSKAKRGSLTSLNVAVNTFGGSLMSLGQKEKKNIKKLAKSVTHKVEKVGNKARKSLSSQHRAEQNTSPLPNKFDINSSSPAGTVGLSTPKSSTNPFLKRSLTKNLPNRDPGVNSEDEDEFDGDLGEDDMFRFDALSHRSSNNSMNVSENMGVVSKNSTPLSGSLENIGGGELLRKTFGTPGRRGLAAGSQSPLVNNSRTLSSTLPRKNVSNSTPPVLDEWEQKLLGKKGLVPYVSPSGNSSGGQQNSSSGNGDTLSLQSSNHSSRSNTLERQRHSTKDTVGISRAATLPTHEETPCGHKKKIIPVGIEFECSPSPEFPSSPKNGDSELDGSGSSSKKKNKMNFKWKSSVKSLVDTGRTGSMFNLSTIGRGFRDKDVSSPKHKISNESLNHKTHSRTHSDGSGSSQQGMGAPPTGTRVAPLGRETTPTPNAPQRIPREIWDRFENKTREDLIESIVHLQSQLETQGKKQVDLEEYLDSLLMKVMSQRPELLQKDRSMTAASKLTPSIKKGLFDSWVAAGRQ